MRYIVAALLQIAGVIWVVYYATSPDTYYSEPSAPETTSHWEHASSGGGAGYAVGAMVVASAIALMFIAMGLVTRWRRGGLALLAGGGLPDLALRGLHLSHDGALSRARISLYSGNRLSCCFEKISSPFASTSNWPFDALLDLGFVLRLGVQLGRETRGPRVIAVSDGAVLDEDARHGEKPTD